jgi:hypothetical protein
MKWKIENLENGKIIHIDPKERTLIIHNATLTNKQNSAKKIHDGANKFPCAYIVAENVEIKSRYGEYHGELEQIKFNPRENPFWSLKGENIDSTQYKKIITIGKGVFIFTGIGSKGDKESINSYNNRLKQAILNLTEIKYPVHSGPIPESNTTENDN